MKLFLTIIVVALLAGVFRAPAFLVCEGVRTAAGKGGLRYCHAGGNIIRYHSLACLQSGRCRKYVAAEYLKIAWFLVYSWFV